MNEAISEQKPPLKPDGVCILSGGIDSTVLLYKLLAEGKRPYALSFDYGQRHMRELSYAKGTAIRTNTPFLKVLLECELFEGSSQTSNIPVPHGHYAEESMKATIVPNRNMVMLAMAAAFCISVKGRYIAYGAHSGDHAIYPDCRQSFVDGMQLALMSCDWNPPQLIAPFLNKSKTDVVKEGSLLQVPFELTYSCYEGRIYHCGKCGTCVERREAFVEANVEDPTAYEI